MSIVTRRGDSWARNLARFVANMRRSPTGVSHSLAACLRGFQTRLSAHGRSAGHFPLRWRLRSLLVRVRWAARCHPYEKPIAKPLEGCAHPPSGECPRPSIS